MYELPTEETRAAYIARIEQRATDYQRILDKAGINYRDKDISFAMRFVLDTLTKAISMSLMRGVSPLVPLADIIQEVGVACGGDVGKLADSLIEAQKEWPNE